MSTVQKKTSTQKSTLSYIEPHEEQKAKELVKETLGFEPPRTCGYKLTLKLFLNEDDDKFIFYDKAGTKVVSSLINPETERSLNRFKSCVGLVIGMGPDCYQGDRFKHTGPWCKIGDFVAYPRHEGTQLYYRGVVMHTVDDDKVFWIVSDPTFVTKE